MDTGQGRALIRLYPLYGYWTGQGTDKAIPSVWILDRAGLIRLYPLYAGSEITPEIPEIAGKNTIIPAKIVYLPENLASRNYWLLFITYLLVRW